jgi:hypothetical protein
MTKYKKNLGNVRQRIEELSAFDSYDDYLVVFRGQAQIENNDHSLERGILPSSRELFSNTYRNYGNNRPEEPIVE